MCNQVGVFSLAQVDIELERQCLGLGWITVEVTGDYDIVQRLSYFNQGNHVLEFLVQTAATRLGVVYDYEYFGFGCLDLSFDCDGVLSPKGRVDGLNILQGVATGDYDALAPVRRRPCKSAVCELKLGGRLVPGFCYYHAVSLKLVYSVNHTLPFTCLIQRARV